MYQHTRVDTSVAFSYLVLKTAQEDRVSQACFIDRKSRPEISNNLPQIIQLVSDRNR